MHKMDTVHRPRLPLLPSNRKNRQKQTEKTSDTNPRTVLFWALTQCSGDSLPTFRDYLSDLSSRIESLTLDDGAESSVFTTTRRVTSQKTAVLIYEYFAGKP
jgi:hypothetical protein